MSGPIGQQRIIGWSKTAKKLPFPKGKGLKFRWMATLIDCGGRRQDARQSATCSHEGRVILRVCTPCACPLLAVSVWKCLAVYRLTQLRLCICVNASQSVIYSSSCVAV